MYQKLYLKTKHLMAVLNLPCHHSIWLTFQFVLYHLSGIWWDATFFRREIYFEWNVTNNDTLVSAQWFSTFYYMRLLLLRDSHKTQLVIQYKTIIHEKWIADWYFTFITIQMLMRNKIMSKMIWYFALNWLSMLSPIISTYNLYYNWMLLIR